MGIKRFRTIHGAYEEIKSLDSNSFISESAIRSIVTSGEIPSKKRGNRYIIDLDILLNYLSGEGQNGK